MRRCPVCEGLLAESLFQGNSETCQVCETRLKRDGEVNYVDSGKRKTIRQSYTNLMLAIKQQAMLDGALEEWQEFWLMVEPWPQIWKLLGTTMNQIGMLKNNQRRYVGGRR